MDGIQGAVLTVKLQYLDEWNAKRRQHAAQYRELLVRDERIQLIDEQEGVEGIYHLFVVRVQNREEVQKALTEKGISTGIHYPVPLHLLKACESLGYKKGAFPVAEQLSGEILSLPMYPELTESQIEYVAESLRSVL
jgi:dTDP-4-amino-4,6-dideoxygalactose transaminase